MAEETLLPPRDTADLDAVRSVLAEEGEVSLVGQAGLQVHLPEILKEALVHVVDAMRRGQGITLAPRAQRLTTQEAADLLGISRPTLVKLLEEGKIPFETPGRHRRIKLADLLTYQAMRRSGRREALRDLARDAQELELYETPAQSFESALVDARKKLG